MKRLVILGLALALAIPTVFAARKKEVAGSIKDNVYQDAQNDFQMNVDPNWKAAVGKADGATRLVLLQRNYAIPPQYANAQDYTQIPRLAVFVDSTGLSAAAYVDSVLSVTYKSKMKKELVNDFEFLNQPNIVVKNRRMVDLAKHSAIVWNAEAKYVKDVASSSSSSEGSRVSGAYRGVIIAVKNGSTIVVFHLVCEANFYDGIWSEADKMIQSLTWTKENQ